MARRNNRNNKNNKQVNVNEERQQVEEVTTDETSHMPEEENIGNGEHLEEVNVDEVNHNETNVEEPTEEVSTEQQEVIEEPKEENTVEVVSPVKETIVEKTVKVTEDITPIKKEVKPESKVTPKIETSRNKLNISDIQRLLKDRKLSFDEKLRTIAKDGISEVRTIAAGLVAYQDQVGDKNGLVDVKFVAGKNKNLLNLIKKVLELKGENSDIKFKTMFDLVNLAFIAYKKDGYNIFNLHRGDLHWTDRKELNTFNILTVIISDLASLATRKEKAIKIDLNKVLTKDEVSLSENAINRIKAYYNV